MLEKTNYQDNDLILKKCFDCLSRCGLEQTTVRKLCEATKLSASSLYYRFSDKDQIVVEATLWGLKHITSNLFLEAIRTVGDFDTMLSVLLNSVNEQKFKIKLAYQVMASPKYGKQFRDMALEASNPYDEYLVALSNQFGCSIEEISPYIDLSIAAIREYVIWEDSLLLQKELLFIRSKLIEDCEKKRDRENGDDNLKELY